MITRIGLVSRKIITKCAGIQQITKIEVYTVTLILNISETLAHHRRALFQIKPINPCQHRRSIVAASYLGRIVAKSSSSQYQCQSVVARSSSSQDHREASSQHRRSIVAASPKPIVPRLPTQKYRTTVTCSCVLVQRGATK